MAQASNVLNSSAVSIGRLKALGISTLQFLIAAAFLGLSLIGCQPKDEKVSTRKPFAPRTGSASGAPANLAFEDRSLEYSRSMLVELNLIASQVESTLSVSQKLLEPQPQDEDPNVKYHLARLADALRWVKVLIDEKLGRPTGDVLVAPGPGEVAAKVPAPCRLTRNLTSPEGTLEFLTETRDCKDQGKEFDAQSFGREVAFVVLGTKNERPFAKAMRIQSKGMDTNLRPLSNPKDSLKARFFRFLDVQYVSSEGELDLYRYFHESEGTYFLDLKAFTDDGVIRTKQAGILVVESTTGKVREFRSIEKSDRFDLTVESSRKCRNCTNNSARQEFRSSGIVSMLELDLEKCLLPQGIVEARYTIRDLSSRDKKYLVDVSSKLGSAGELVRDLSKAGTETRSKVSASACAADKTTSPSEFFSGLLY
jgi:hypothetical protein